MRRSGSGLLKKKRTMLRKPRKYIEPSFHAYVHERLARDPVWAWSRLDTEAMTSLLGLQFIAYLDRLEYAKYDVEPAIEAMERLVESIDAKSAELARDRSEWASVIRHLNRLNRRQLELMRLNDEKLFPELAHLALEMMNRIEMIDDALLHSGTDRTEIGMRYAEWLRILNRMADHLDCLALRHFCSAFKRGEIESLAAVCLGCNFLRAVAGAIEFRLTDAWMWDFARRYYDLGALIALGEQFDFDRFDDDTNELHPDVADLLYGGAEDRV